MAEMELRKLANFASELEARMLEGMLAAEGIACVLNNAEFVADFWHYGNAVGGVTVQVAEEDWDAAQAVLSPDHPVAESWVCPVCGTKIEAEFNSCWKCAGVHVPEPIEAFDEEGDEISPPSSLVDLSDGPGGDVEPTATSETLQRAWKASIIGCMIPMGILNLYSLYLLFIHVPTESLTVAEIRRFVVACIVNTLTLSTIFGFFVWFF